jgi:hypothetical protein
MKADLSRQTFDPKKRYSGVLMQQGRVLLDSEWNEQQEIQQHRTESGTEDVIGSSGTPIGEDGKASGFEITAQDGKLYVGEGHIYVDGILCVNDSNDPIPYDEQPDPPNPDDLTKWMDGESAESEDGALKLGLVYLDVWERHITHLDDGRIREVALGGPDTTTRKQTVWQVKVMDDFPIVAAVLQVELELLTRYAELRAKSELNEGEREELNQISPRAVEILGSVCKKGEKALDELGEPPTGKLSVQTKEQTGKTGLCQIPPGGGYERLENQLYRVEVHRKGNVATARFKWSRDNGCLATGIEKVDVGRKEITVKDTGRDEFLSFANGQWVEIVDEHTELQGQYRQLLQIDKPVDCARRVITVRQTPPAIDPDLHPKLRRWDQNGEANEDGLKLEKQELEDGVEVEFTSGEYRAGDYWLIPARTATGDIEWLREDSETVAQSPHGVQHSICALAIVAAAPKDDSESELSVLHDCRNLFPPLTKLTSFFYLGGDGQEAMPDKELLEPLRVGVANGQWPVREARVRYEILDSAGTLRSEDGSASGDSITVVTGADGVVACRWTLDADTENQSQRVRATLLDTEDEAVHLPIQFVANLSVASQVGYDPSNCGHLSDNETVQAALDALCQNSALYYVGGNGQEAMPGQFLPKPLQVRVANGRWPVQGAQVRFEAANGTLQADGESGGTVTPQTGSSGVAECTWQLDAATQSQQVEAHLLDDSGNLIQPPVRFTANLSVASKVSYDPANCEFLGQAQTIQEAIDRLCQDGAPEPGFHVTEVRLIKDQTAVVNGEEISVEDLVEGFFIICDREVDGETINQDTCFVTIGMPWRVRATIDNVETTEIVGSWPLILSGTPKSEGRMIEWRPEFKEHVADMLHSLGEDVNLVLAHLTLRGNFIQAEAEPDVYLDGDTFRDPESEFGIRQPTGDGRRGGD